MAFQHSLVVIKNYFTATEECIDNYRFCLKSIKELLAHCVFDPCLAYELANYVDPAISPAYEEEIYVILPINGRDKHTSLILYKDSWLVVELAPNEIVKEILMRFNQLKYEPYIKAIQSFFDTKIRTVPVATTRYSLMPIGGKNDKQTIWINSGRVSKIITNPFNSTVIFDNHFKLAVERVELRIYELMRRGFISHGVIKRDFTNLATHPTTFLFNYLDISSTEVTRKILKGISYNDLPGKYLDFRNSYNKSYNDYQRKIFLKELDIEA